MTNYLDLTINKLYYQAVVLLQKQNLCYLLIRFFLGQKRNGNALEKSFFFIEKQAKNPKRRKCSVRLVLEQKKKQPSEVFCKKAAFKNFAIFTGKYLC